jgi:hypothetical protein
MFRVALPFQALYLASAFYECSQNIPVRLEITARHAILYSRNLFLLGAGTRTGPPMCPAVCFLAICSYMSRWMLPSSARSRVLPLLCCT